MTLESEGPSVRVTLDEIYKTVLAIDKKVDPLPPKVEDHDERIREIERREDLTRRVTQLETSLEQIKRLVWALPAPAFLVAVLAIALPYITNK